MPCAPCVRSRNGLSCSYRDDAPNTAAVADEGLNPLSTADDRPESHTRETQTPEVDSETLRTVEAKLQRLELQVYGNASHTPDGAQNGLRLLSQGLDSRLLRLERIIAQQPALRQAEPPQSAPAPRLRITPDRTRLYGPSHWVHSFDHVCQPRLTRPFGQSHKLLQFRAIGRVNPKDIESLRAEMPGNVPELLDLVKQCSRLRSSVKRHRRQLHSLHLNMAELAATLPDKERCDHLVEHYLRTFEPLFRIVHIPSFRQEYQQLWDWSQDQAVPTSLPAKGSLMKLVLVLAIGNIFHGNLAESTMLSSTARNWIFTATRWLADDPFGKARSTLEGLQVHCLLVIARQLYSLGSDVWVSTEALLQSALSQGFHMDPRHFSSLTPFQSEMRRRLWYTILELTLQTSLDSSMPLLLSRSDFSTEPPLNVDDDKLEPDAKEQQLGGKPDGVFTDCSLQIWLSRSVPARLEVVRLLNSLDAAQSYDTALRLSTQIQVACRDMAISFEQHQAGFLASHFHQKFIDMYLRRYLVFLHRPFMLQARSDPRYYLSRKIGFKSCCAIASQGENLNLPSDAANDLARLFIHGRGCYRGPLSLDVTTMLGLEVVTQLEEESVEGSAGLPVDLLDQAAREGRSRAIKSLEHIRDQQREVIALGHPSLQRFMLTSAILRQISAMETGQNIRVVVTEVLIQAAQTCLSLLQSMLASVSASDMPVDSPSAATYATLTIGDGLDLDLDALLSMNWFGQDTLDSWASLPDI